jgi:hypothetical protein
MITRPLSFKNDFAKIRNFSDEKKSSGFFDSEAEKK